MHLSGTIRTGRANFHNGQVSACRCGEEEVGGEGGVESEPKSAAASDVEDDDLPTHLQQVFVDEFAR